MKRIYNFGAGPATLPVSVLEALSKTVKELGSTGMSVLEVSHRSKPYEAIHFSARDRLLKLMGLSSSDYQVMFLGGGASLQFAMLPMNFLGADDVADYSITGDWSAKALKEAKRISGKAQGISSSAEQKYTLIQHALMPSAGSKYVHITTNNTIEGTQWKDLPDVGSTPLIADASSDILSRRVPFDRFALIYAGAQKNLGPAGVTVVVARKSFLATALDRAPAILQYKTHAEADSLYNTPPAFAIHALDLVLEWVESEGGLEKVEARNERKAAAIYSALDECTDAYDPAVTVKGDRSSMNITFRLKAPADKLEALEKSFLAGAVELGMDGLKGHRSVGGFRASIYNAFPEEGAQKLAEYLRAFAKKL